MNDAVARTIFAIICLLAVVAVAVGGILEVLRQKRGESLLRPGQFRLRILSAFVWIILLGSLSYAVAFLWPHDRESARKFLTLVSGSFLLLIVALLLLAYDMWQVGRQRRVSERKFHQQLEGMAQEEIQKLQAEQRQSQTAPTPNVPPNESGGL